MAESQAGPKSQESNSDLASSAPEPPTVLYSWQNFVPPITMHYLRDYDEANLKVSELKPGPLGFDLEWKPTFKKGGPQNRVALVQLANHETILLLHICAMRSFPECLKAVLEDPAYIKVGAGIQYDSKKIHFDYGIEMKNCVDLSLLARSVDSQWKGKYTNPIGLARLVAMYENLALSKGKTARSNWEGLLDEKQKEYASNDAHSGFTIYSRLIQMAKTVEPVPKPFYYSYHVVRGILCTQSEELWHPHNPYYDPGPPPPPKELESSGHVRGIHRGRSGVDFEPSLRLARIPVGLSLRGRNHGECVRMLRRFFKGKI